MWHKRHGIKVPFSANSILCTGASGALGGALASLHARPGIALNLWGRDRNKLDLIAGKIRAAGAEARQFSQDLTDGHAAVDAVLKQDVEARFDLAYLVAGIGDTRAPEDLVEDPLLVLRAAQINFAAPAAMAAALAARMAERGHGRIVLIGSAAGHHSLPFAAGYSGSKAGLARFADALRIAVEPLGVRVTLAAPGFIDTPALRATSTNRPMKLDVDAAARRIARAAERGKRHYITPWPFSALRILDALLPAQLRDRIMAGLDP
ncbi:SDR family NAD(P)-dependent oxidoreductase [Qipengyuania qiaonensis]|uniref:SDR family NAD(P)-dependent oxidoreductase n=1 Tax=Qipengyuania qiaonensis TaxID=2867240 RepID=A0ABS7J3S5_9SPHN|nr:SDR family NAD(P)-dependent oxidoreductase [Qipengyuania qiaonensis]MBX7481990.1 SDR family NAD(P)-dependent oxidoreductase [Qipengyuania qiaonensis]